jgi:hypothetical protein
MNGSDLLLSHDKKTNAIIGGGYTLNSSFLNANISPFVQMNGGARSRNRRNRSDKSDKSDRSKSDRSKSDRSDSDDDPEMKVSTLLERANSNKFIIPAGIFMMHPSSHQEEENEKEPVPMSTKLKDFIYSADHNDNPDNYDHQEQVVPSDLYEKLLSMVSPADKKRYWDPKSTTRKRGTRNQDVTPSSIKSKTRRKV